MWQYLKLHLTTFKLAILPWSFGPPGFPLIAVNSLSRNTSMLFEIESLEEDIEYGGKALPKAFQNQGIDYFD